MAGLYFHVTSGEVALVASTPLSVLQVKAAANHRVLIHEIQLMGKQAAGGTDFPVSIRATRSTANFGTFTAATAALEDPDASETLQATCGTTASAEPTTPTDTGWQWELQPEWGLVQPVVPPIVVPGGMSWQLEATSSATPTLCFSVRCEE